MIQFAVLKSMKKSELKTFFEATGAEREEKQKKLEAMIKKGINFKQFKTVIQLDDFEEDEYEEEMEEAQVEEQEDSFQADESFEEHRNDMKINVGDLN